MSEKKIVHYKNGPGTFIAEQQHALIWPIDHTGSWVSNTTLAKTSLVVSYNKETGDFETRNSIYKLVKE